MTNGTKLITGNHLETASVNAKRYILAELLALTNTITAELNLKADDEIFSAGASGIVPAPTANDANNFLRGDGQWATPTVIIGTTSSTVDGGLWFEVVDGLPVAKMKYGGNVYSLNPTLVRPTLEIYDSNDDLIGTVPYTKTAVEYADELDAEDADAFRAYYEEAQALEVSVDEFCWLAVSESLPNNFAWAKYPFICDGENPQCLVNNNPMEIVNVDGNDYFAQLTEFGAITICHDEE